MNEQRALTVAVAGGIGSGKSVVCRILRAMDFEVFDTDSEAKRIMDADERIHERLNAEIHPEAVVDGKLDRARISEVAFASAPKLAALNRIVHAAVRRELTAWIASHTPSRPLFVETAILYQSGLDKMVDRVWEVTAPENVRVERVMKRNGLTDAQVRSRIDAQRFVPEKMHPCVTELVNDGAEPLLPQIERALEALGYGL